MNTNENLCLIYLDDVPGETVNINGHYRKKSLIPMLPNCVTNVISMNDILSGKQNFHIPKVTPIVYVLILPVLLEVFGAVRINGISVFDLLQTKLQIDYDKSVLLVYGISANIMKNDQHPLRVHWETGVQSNVGKLNYVRDDSTLEYQNVPVTASPTLERVEYDETTTELLDQLRLLKMHKKMNSREIAHLENRLKEEKGEHRRSFVQIVRNHSYPSTAYDITSSYFHLMNMVSHRPISNCRKYPNHNATSLYALSNPPQTISSPLSHSTGKFPTWKPKTVPKKKYNGRRKTYKDNEGFTHVL